MKNNTLVPKRVSKNNEMLVKVDIFGKLDMGRSPEWYTECVTWGPKINSRKYSCKTCLIVQYNTFINMCHMKEDRFPGIHGLIRV